MSSDVLQSMDPQQRHLLEVSYEAFENAGLRLPGIAGTPMGVFVGATHSEYSTLLAADVDDLPIFEATGNAESISANRLSYFYDLRGPSLAIDTACSSSLVALNMAIQSLQAGESDSALVCSSAIRLRPEASVSLSSMKYARHGSERR